MLKIIVPAGEVFIESTQEFVSTKETTLCLEHSLVSLSKWESRWCKPFLSKDPKTYEETLDYIKCMTITQNVDDNVYRFLTSENVDDIKKYIDNPSTATWFSDNQNGKRSHEQITSELIYYWMVAHQIPFDPCQKWHLNRLITLIRICNLKQQPEKKMSPRAILSQNAAINAARRKQWNSKG